MVTAIDWLRVFDLDMQAAMAHVCLDRAEPLSWKCDIMAGRAAVCTSTQLALLPPCDPASVILLSGGLIPGVEPQQTEGASASLGAAAADPSGHRVGGHQSAATKTSRANMRRADHTALARTEAAGAGVTGRAAFMFYFELL